MPTATKILHFLEAQKESHRRNDIIVGLTALTADILTESNDSALHDLLKRCGWDAVKNAYDPAVDLEKLENILKKLTERRNHKTSLVRASQVGLRNTIKSFAPDMLMAYQLDKRNRLDDIPLVPVSVFFQGVILIADISGFTRLSGTYCFKGKEGIDDLQQATNGYLGELVKLIYAYGGDVMKFAGDAIICVFQPRRYTATGKELNIADLCSNAVQCATDLSQICTAELTIHVAVSCGPMCFAMLGGHNDLWEALVSGFCVGHLSQCLEDAESKQTVVSPVFVETLGPMYRKELNIELLPSGNYRVISAHKMNSLVVRKMIKRRGEMLLQDCELRFAMFPNDPEFLTAIRNFVPMPVSDGLKSGSFDYLAELREVTTMFMSWDSYDEVIHNDLLSLQQCFLAAQKVLVESGGFIRQFLVDDKGCVLIACWGVPTASHPDNTRRALCAGAIIGYELNELGMKTSVGITTGNVFCGSVGSYVRREYAVIGDVVNLAARLMSKAKGRLLTDEATYNRIPIFLKNHMDRIAPMAVKGKEELVSSYALREGIKNISFDDKGVSEMHIDTLTIRPACKEPLLENMQRIATKIPVPLKFIIIEGKMGAGKFEVVEWLKQTGPKMDIRIISLLMASKNKDKSFHMVTQLFRLLVGEEIFDNVESQNVVVRHILREVYKADTETIMKVAYPTVWTALGVKRDKKMMKKNPIQAKLPPRLLNQCLRDIFTHLFSDVPMVVVIEQTHYADLLSWDVIVNLVNISSMTLLVIAMEPLQELLLTKISSVAEIVREDIFTATDMRDSTCSPIFLNRLRLNHKKLCVHKGTTVVLMNDYSVLEVDNLLCSVLGLESCPASVASMVHKLSGGNPFWCKEMALFIHTTGADEFMKAMNPPESPVGKDTFDSREISSPTNGGRRSAGTAFYTFKSRESVQYKWRTTSSSGVESNDAGYGTPTSKVHASLVHSSLAHASPGHPSLAHTQQAEDGKSEGGDMIYNGYARSDTTSKLELFIVCRLEKLCREDQNILRTASIIGDTFSTDILYGVLPPKLRVKMFNSIDSLVKNQWIAESADDHGKYKFVHPLFYQTVYDVTPASDKARLHYAIAIYIEDKFDSKPTYYAQLGHQYGLARDCRPKALEYFVRAAVFCLSNGPTFYDEGLELLMQAKIFIDSTIDCDVIISILTFNRNNLIKMRRKLLEDEEKNASQLSPSIPIEGKRTFFKWSFSFQRITPHSLPTSHTSPNSHHSDKSPNLRNEMLSEMSSSRMAPTYKPDGCGLTVNGTDVFVDLLQRIEDDFNILLTDLIKDNILGATLEWQKIMKDDMRGATLLDENNSIRDRKELSKLHRGNVLILAADSIKMISSAVGQRKTSLLDLLGKTNAVVPMIGPMVKGSNSGSVSNFHSSILGVQSGLNAASLSFGSNSGLGTVSGRNSGLDRNNGFNSGIGEIDTNKERIEGVEAVEPILNKIPKFSYRDHSFREKTPTTVNTGIDTNNTILIPLRESRAGNLKCTIS